MEKRKLKYVPIVWLLMIAVITLGPSARPADIVYKNDRIYTVNRARPWAEAITVDDGEIVFVGSDEEAATYIGRRTKVEDLAGKFMMPGIIAGHEHSIVNMVTSSGLYISELSHDKDKMLAEVKAYLKKNPDGPYYSFGGAYENSIFSLGCSDSMSVSL